MSLGDSRHSLASTLTHAACSAAVSNGTSPGERRADTKIAVVTYWNGVAYGTVEVGSESLDDATLTVSVQGSTD